VFRKLSTTLLKLARRGTQTEEMRIVSESEGIPIEFLIQRIASGKVIIPRAAKHPEAKVIGIGEGLSTKVNVNVGSSTTYTDIPMEVEKAKVALEYGTDALMDLSIGGDLDFIRRKLLDISKVPFGSVPIYQAYIEAAKKYGSPVLMDEDSIFNTIEKHFKDGVDFVTVHTGITRDLVMRLQSAARVAGVVSRGGATLAAWMLHNAKENPLYKNFDYLLELATSYDATLSLGDAFRPGGIADACDEFHISELVNNARLTAFAWQKDVQVMIEGPGHVPLHKVAADVRLEKSLSKGAPYYVLGPLVTDIAVGYDHIASAIGAAIAASEGADLICYLTPSEHLSLPNVQQVKEGLIAAKVAAHAGDIAKLGDKATKRDLEISKAKTDFDWEAIFDHSFDAEHARQIHGQFASPAQGPCTMCGDMCVYLLLPKYLKANKRP
jgi:phosphomethylpyrimidine synthase